MSNYEFLDAFNIYLKKHHNLSLFVARSLYVGNFYLVAFREPEHILELHSEVRYSSVGPEFEEDCYEFIRRVLKRRG